MGNEFFNEPEWINVPTAMRLVHASPVRATSKMAFLRAAQKGKFIRKAADGFHWEIHKPSLQDFLYIAGLPNQTFIAKAMGVTTSRVTYLAMKHGIELKTRYGRKYLDPADGERLKKLIEEHTHD